MKTTKQDVIELLKNRQVTYKELAKQTGYHEKYLIYLNQILQKQPNLLKKKRQRTSKLDSKFQEEMKRLFLTKENKSMKEFYEKYIFPKISYSYFLHYFHRCSWEILILKKRKEGNQKYLCAIDFQSNEILIECEIKELNRAILNILEQVFQKYQVPENIYFSKISKMRTEIQNILTLNQIHSLPKNQYIETRTKKFLKKQKFQGYHKNIQPQTSFFLEKEVYMNRNHTFQYRNQRFFILDFQFGIDRYGKIYEKENQFYFMYEGKKYQTKRILQVISKKGKTKY